MPRPADPSRFGEGSTGGDWYDPPYPRTLQEVQAWPMFADRAAWLHQEYPSGAIAIAGAGVGWTGYFLYTNHNRQPYMCDLTWIASIGAGVIPGGTSRIRALDVLDANQMQQFRRMGNQGQNRYPVLLTEDLLPSLSDDAEVAVALANLRGIATTVVHLITPLEPTTTQTPDMLWHTYAEWRSLIGPSERIISPSLVEVP